MATVVGKIEKQPAEVLNISFDFSSAVNTDATISINTVFTDSTDITVSGEVVSGTSVNMSLSGGVTGNQYKITVRVDTSDGETIEADAKVKVKEL